jgi:hypothetical protein
MNNGIYAIVKRYEQNGVEFEDWLYKPNNHYGIYDKMMELTGDDHEISSGAASWCELATVGEIYEFREGEIEIVEID